MVKKSLGYKWSRFWIGSKIWKPKHLKYRQMAAILTKKNILILDKTSRFGMVLFLNGWENSFRHSFKWESGDICIHAHFLLLCLRPTVLIAKARPFEIWPSKSLDFKCSWISNGRISGPHWRTKTKLSNLESTLFGIQMIGPFKIHTFCW